MPKRSVNDMVVDEPGAVPSMPLFTSSEADALRMMSIMKEAYGFVPAALWGLSKTADLVAPPRGFVVGDEKSSYIYSQRVKASALGGYPIVSLRIKWWRDDPLIVIHGVRKLNVEDPSFNGELQLCKGVEELSFVDQSIFNRRLELPPGLKTILFGKYFNVLVSLPPGLTEIFFTPISFFNQPITVPSSARKAVFGLSFNERLTFSAEMAVGHNMEQLSELEELLFEEDGDFNQHLTLPRSGSLRTLRLSRDFNQQINLVEGLESVYFGWRFDQSIDLPESLVEVTFGGNWFNQYLLLPPRLQKLSR